ncbi:hypothetical protein HDK77DRAFT_486481 [Phyllosticta capitalensis]
MARSKTKMRPQGHRRLRLPSTPLLGGHVEYMRRPRREKRSRNTWSLRVNHHQRSGSPFSHRSHPPKQRAKRLAAKSWRRVKRSSSILLDKAKCNERLGRAVDKVKQCSCKEDDNDFLETKKLHHPAALRGRQRRPKKSKSSIRQRLDKLADKTVQAGKFVQRKRDDLRFAVNTSTTVANAVAKAEVMRNNVRKSCCRKQKEITDFVGKLISRAEKVLEQTGIRLDSEDVGRRRTSEDNIHMEKTPKAHRMQIKSERDRNALERANERTKGSSDGARLWGPRVGPAPERRWRI